MDTTSLALRKGLRALLTLWIVVTLVSRYVSVGSITAAIAFTPIMVAINWAAFGRAPRELLPLIVFAAAMSLLLVFRHRTNIRRLVAGTENKIGAKKDSPHSQLK